MTNEASFADFHTSTATKKDICMHYLIIIFIIS